MRLIPTILLASVASCQFNVPSAIAAEQSAVSALAKHCGQPGALSSYEAVILSLEPALQSYASKVEASISKQLKSLGITVSTPKVTPTSTPNLATLGTANLCQLLSSAKIGGGGGGGGGVSTSQGIMSTTATPSPAASQKSGGHTGGASSVTTKAVGGHSASASPMSTSSPAGAPTVTGIGFTGAALIGLVGAIAML